ncbi:hypothetical protein, unlikely [Trypanosoma brucei gambiense DAL972]|uniref:Uncharacterized protein n=1 Tax=Trypanosoma brucei gambiense (strain MHOM/CI/86/DAL972) TaxID=679716 RepID=C9ZQ14_TRYB9|nr:hypothetical protein, unlikely [Trypanosoma brucei gambiense DAL972]CBH11492.1 hypothetical protein, unlikely [Trypanosoma brucei gambiense DAL972]|eukprot:XP_011773779.1 hypothetical protein, unlikely [Trypanosoma brucei gambiense DAL972]
MPWHVVVSRYLSWFLAVIFNASFRFSVGCRTSFRRPSGKNVSFIVKYFRTSSNLSVGELAGALSSSSTMHFFNTFCIRLSVGAALSAQSTVVQTLFQYVC